MANSRIRGFSLALTRYEHKAIAHMLSEAKCAAPWDLADKRTQKIRFSSASFYIIVDGIQSESVRSACKTLKTFVLSKEGVRCRGPKAMPTERRRWMKMREMKDGPTSKGVYLTQALRYRSILLVVQPTNDLMTALIRVELPSDVNIKIEPYANQFDLREDR